MATKRKATTKGKGWPIEGLSKFVKGLQKTSPGAYEVAFRLAADGQIEDFHMVAIREEVLAARAKASSGQAPRQGMEGLRRNRKEP